MAISPQLKYIIMYIIEFEDGVYAAKGKGDPSRTLKIENAQRFGRKIEAERRLSIVLDEIKPFRKFDNPKIHWVDEVSGIISNSDNWV